MNILAISDTHTYHRDILASDLEGIDMIIHAGDISNVKQPYSNQVECLDFLEWYESLPIKYKILIAGNHDTSIEAKFIDLKKYPSAKILKLNNIINETGYILINALNEFLVQRFLESKLNFTDIIHKLLIILNSKLINMGILREVIRTIQEERKNSGFDVSDRINVQWQAPAEVAAAIESGLAEIKSETLAIEVKPAKVVGGTQNELGLLLKLEKVN